MLQFNGRGRPKVAHSALPWAEGALLGQVDDDRNLHRHTWDLLRGCQASVDPSSIFLVKDFSNGTVIKQPRLRLCLLHHREHLHSSNWKNLGSSHPMSCWVRRAFSVWATRSERRELSQQLCEAEAWIPSAGFISGLQGVILASSAGTSGLLWWWHLWSVHLCFGP